MIVENLNEINLTGLTNPVYKGDCCNGELRLRIKLSSGEVDREVHDITWTDGCGGFIKTINGLPYISPLPIHIFLIQDDESYIDLVIEFCSCYFTSGPSNWFGQLQIHSLNPNNTQTFDYEFEYINFDPYPQASSGGIVTYLCENDCDELQPDPILVYNDTAAWMEVSFSWDPLPSPQPSGVTTWYLNGVAQTSGTFFVPPLTVSEVNYTLCPPEFLSTKIVAEICDNKVKIPVSVEVVVCNDCGINCYQHSLRTENSYLPQATGYCSNAGSSLYTMAAIGEKKILRLDLEYDNAFTGNDIDIYFNPWLYDVVCSIATKYSGGFINDPPPSGYHFKFQPVYIGAGLQSMTLYGAGVNANCQRNFEAFVEFIAPSVGDCRLFAVELHFYLIEDLDNWVDTGVIPNQYKLLNNHINAPTPFQNIVQSVYTVDKRICSFVYIVDPNISVPVSGTGDPFATPPIPPDTIPYECYTVKSIPITARYYNRGLYDGPSEYTNPIFTLKRNAVSVPNFSTLLKTEVSFKITDFVGGSGVTNVVFWLVNGSNTDNFDTILGNYDSSRSEITTIGGVSVLDNHLQSPSSGPTPLGGGVYEVKAFVDTNLDPNSTYYIIAVVYGSLDFMVNSFISGPITVTQIPGVEICCPLNILSNWSDYYRGGNSFSPVCFAPTMKERIRNSLSVTANGLGKLADCLSSYGYTGNWIDLITTVGLNIYRKEDNFPNVGQTTFFYYNTYNSIRVAGFPNDFNNPFPEFTVAKSGTTLNILWEGRVRYEDTLPVSGGSVYVANTSTAFTRVPAAALGSTYVSTLGITHDWADEDIFFEYVFNFDLSSVFGLPCTLVQSHINKIHPIDFETNPVPEVSLLKDLVIYGYPGAVEITGPFCEGTFDYLEVSVFSNNTINPLKGYLIAMLDPSPYGINGLLEEDATPSPYGFTQLDAVPIYDLSTYFNNFGTFKVDLSGLGSGKYQICGLYIDDPSILPNP